jgi:hypothetical protein
MNNFFAQGTPNMANIIRAAALALGLAFPGIAQAATDGATGTSSTATFQATTNANAPGGPIVQIIGLQDMTIGPLTLTPDDTLPGLFGYGDLVCFNRSDAGGVNITLTQTNGSVASGSALFSLVETVDTNNNGTFDTIPVIFTITEPSGSDLSVENDTPLNTQASASGCADFSPMPDAHRLAVRLDNSTIGERYSPGDYAGQFTILLRAQ